MIDTILQVVQPLKPIASFLMPLVPFVRKIPATIKSAKRWKKNKQAKAEAELYWKMKRYKLYRIDDSTVRADNRLDLFTACWMLLAGMLPLASAIFSFQGATIERYWGVALLLEAFACFYGASIWFGRNAERQQKCRNPERTKILFEIELMQVRLTRLHEQIRSSTDPMLPEEAQMLRAVSKKLPDWYMEK